MKIDRPNIDIQPFAGSSKTEERTAFGSKEITDNLEKNLNAYFARGWGVVPVSELPTMQDFNAVGFTISSLVTHLYQNGIAEYAEKQIYNKGAVCLSEGNIYISKTENNAGNPLTDTTQWQSLKDAILAANIVQQIGNATDKVMSQKSVTDVLNSKQQKGDYATKTELTQGLNTKLNSAAVKQTTGNSTTDVMSQKACTDTFAKKDSQEPFSAGDIKIKSKGNYTSLTLIKDDGNKLLLETAPGDAYFVYRDVEGKNKAVVTIPSAKNGTLALTADVILSEVPIGASVIWSSEAKYPKNFWPNEGRTFSSSDYPVLAKIFPNLKLPDDRGYAIRVADNGKGIDLNRKVNTYQEDAVQNIVGEIDDIWLKSSDNQTGTGAFRTLNTHNKQPSASNSIGRKGISFDASRSVRTAVETRMKNVAKILITRVE